MRSSTVRVGRNDPSLGTDGAAESRTDECGTPRTASGHLSAAASSVLSRQIRHSVDVGSASDKRCVTAIRAPWTEAGVLLELGSPQPGAGPAFRPNLLDPPRGLIVSVRVEGRGGEHHFNQRALVAPGSGVRQRLVYRSCYDPKVAAEHAQDVDVEPGSGMHPPPSIDPLDRTEDGCRRIHCFRQLSDPSNLLCRLRLMATWCARGSTVRNGPQRSSLSRPTLWKAELVRVKHGERHPPHLLDSVLGDHR